MVSPNVIINDAVARFARLVGLGDTDRITLEQRIAEHTGLTLDMLRLDRLTAERDEHLLVIHDRADREVGFHHGERLASLWPNARLLGTDGLGHRRILRDEATIAAAVSLLAEGIPAPASDLVREVDRQLDNLESL
jgi:hypothetical protein